MYSKKRLDKIRKELDKRLTFALGASGSDAGSKEDVIARASQKYRLQIVPYSPTTLLLAEPGSRCAIRCETIGDKQQRVSLSIMESEQPWIGQ
ncbi:MAG: hypothetical protein Q4A01_06050 [Coriobacteriales bacterium]|nr:hypothetical protein [Coriobacteriales bacterium]